MDLGIRIFITVHKEESRGRVECPWPLNSSSTCSEFLSALPPEWYSSGSLDEYSISKCYIHAVANRWLLQTWKPCPGALQQACISLARITHLSPKDYHDWLKAIRPASWGVASSEASHREEGGYLH